MAIRHNYTIICDEVRREDNGKLMILGMYQDGLIGLPQIPFALPSLTFFQSLESDRVGTWTLRIRVEHLESGQRLVDGAGQIGFLRPGSGVNHIRFGNLVITAPGVYNFVLEIDGQTDPIVIPFTANLNIPQVQNVQVPPQNFRR